MTLETIVNTLRKSGINGKKLVINMIENADYKSLCELDRSVREHIALKRIEEDEALYKKMIDELERVEIDE